MRAPAEIKRIAALVPSLVIHTVITPCKPQVLQPKRPSCRYRYQRRADATKHPLFLLSTAFVLGSSSLASVSHLCHFDPASNSSSPSPTIPMPNSQEQHLGLDCVCGERPIFVKRRTRIERLLITHRSIVQRNTHRAPMMPVILPNDTLAPQLPQSRIMITTRGNQVR